MPSEEIRTWQVARGCGGQRSYAERPLARGGSFTIRTHGLTHLGLAVRDPERSLRFYEAAFGAKEYYRDTTSIQVQGPGSHVVMTFEKDEAKAGRRGGVTHFGFRLLRPDDIDSAVLEIERAGGKLLRRGEFGPGLPFAFFRDPDGFEIEVWYE